MKKGDKVKIINGNNEPGQQTMIGKIGVINFIGTEYLVNAIKTKEIYVEFKNFGLHVFNDYHLITL